jgi:hypothetical protein
VTDAPLYTVTGQSRTFAPGNGGTGVRAWRVAFTTRSGVQSTIDVPDTATDYTAENVKGLLTAAATTIEQVHALTGPEGPTP